MIVNNIFRRLRNYVTGLNAMQARFDILQTNLSLLQTNLDTISTSLEVVNEIEKIAESLPSAELLAALLGKSDSLPTIKLEILCSAYKIEAN